MKEPYSILPVGAAEQAERQGLATIHAAALTPEEKEDSRRLQHAFVQRLAGNREDHFWPPGLWKPYSGEGRTEVRANPCTAPAHHRQLLAGNGYNPFGDPRYYETLYEAVYPYRRRWPGRPPHALLVPSLIEGIRDLHAAVCCDAMFADLRDFLGTFDGCDLWYSRTGVVALAARSFHGGGFPFRGHARREAWRRVAIRPVEIWRRVFGKLVDVDTSERGFPNPLREIVYGTPNEQTFRHALACVSDARFLAAAVAVPRVKPLAAQEQKPQETPEVGGRTWEGDVREVVFYRMKDFMGYILVHWKRKGKAPLHLLHTSVKHCHGRGKTQMPTKTWEALVNMISGDWACDAWQKQDANAGMADAVEITMGRGDEGKLFRRDSTTAVPCRVEPYPSDLPDLEEIAAENQQRHTGLAGVLSAPLPEKNLHRDHRVDNAPLYDVNEERRARQKNARRSAI